jgi:hypothetical protein
MRLRDKVARLEAELEAAVETADILAADCVVYLEQLARCQSCPRCLAAAETVYRSRTVEAVDRLIEVTSPRRADSSTGGN